MGAEKLKEYIKRNPKVKRLVLNIITHPVKSRPRFWIRLFLPFYIKRGKGSVIYRSSRKDIAPFNEFSLGKYSIIEDFSTVNNFVGDITIGDYTRVGIGSVIIGPVHIGNHVNLAQNITLSGLDHNFKDITLRIDEQGVCTSQIFIDDDVWVGANSVITKGVKIGRHSIIAACSLVNKDVPPFCIVAGNPARIIKIYNETSMTWKKSF